MFKKLGVMEKRRIFIAINLPEEMKEELFNFSKKWPTLPCRWVRKDNLHLTLVFLGYLKEEELTEVLKITKEVVQNHQSFSVSLNKVCYGPDQRMPPRLVWVKGEKSEDLSKLKNDLEKSLSEKIRLTPENRDFLPHITLGRIKKWNWKRIEPEERQDVNLEVSFKVQINSIEVMESHLKRTGAEYEVLKSFKLEP